MLKILRRALCMSKRTDKDFPLIHHYFGVNLDIVWQIAADELPKVALQLERILREEGEA